MRVAVTVQHPAHVHFFRPLVASCRDAGDEVAIFLREKDVAGALLRGYGLHHETVSSPGDSAAGARPPGDGAAVPARLRRGLPAGVGDRLAAMTGTAGSLAGMASQQLRWELGLTRRLRAFDPDVITAIGGLAAAHAGALLGVPSVVFTDSEVATNRAMAPFAGVVATPRAYDGRSFGHRHRRYDGFHELAYLHPDRFAPDPALLRERGVEPDDPYVVARFGAMGALHDRGERGLSAGGKDRLLSLAAAHGTVYVAAERGPGGPDAGADVDGVEPVPVAPTELHHLLGHADLVVADAATTAVEAGILGTPSVRVTSLAAPDVEMGTLRTLDAAGVVRSTAEETVALRWVESILADPASAADHWAFRRENLLAETIDVAAYATQLVRTVGRSQSLPTPPDRRSVGRRRTGVAAGRGPRGTTGTVAGSAGHRVPTATGTSGGAAPGDVRHVVDGDGTGDASLEGPSANREARR